MAIPGGSLTTNQWSEEMRPGTFSSTSSYDIFHNWSQIKLNLYGTRSIPITYNVWLCQMDEQVDPTSFLPNATINLGSECNNMLRDMARPLLHNTVAENPNVTFRKNMKVLKRTRVTIEPLSYSDQAAQITLPSSGVQSTSPHIHEIRWFVRHNRFRNYYWSKDTDQVIEDINYDNGGWDRYLQYSPNCDVEWGKKVFLFVTATSATPVNIANWPNADNNSAQSQGSLDICVRNSFTSYR